MAPSAFIVNVYFQKQPIHIGLNPFYREEANMGLQD
jgi:hypothetical protein